ncbi:MAG: hypothetical protein ABH842_03210 [Candidatus Micrarchaeota archaeon]
MIENKNFLLYFVVVFLLIIAGLFLIFNSQPPSNPTNLTIHDPCDDNNDGIVDQKEFEICKLHFPRNISVVPAKPGEYIVTQINNSENGKIAVRIDVPSEPRYGNSSPIVVVASTWFVKKYNDDMTQFHLEYNPVDVGAISVSYLWPGKTDPVTKIRSEGTYDFGGPQSIAAFRDVIRFALGEIPDSNGSYLHEIVSINADYDNVGMFASSHSGVVATNVMAYYGEYFQDLKYFVGRENPTTVEMYALEIGHYDEQNKRLENPYYNYSAYTQFSISVDYSTLGWIDAELGGRPYHKVSNGSVYILDYKGPQINDTWYFSPALTQALFDNGAFTLQNWPTDLGKPEEVKSFWEYREPIDNFELIGQKLPNLKVLVSFASRDHVQAAPDKPHIHHAYDGFRKRAGLSWVRLNCDLAYVQSEIDQSATLVGGFPDNNANTEPNDWYVESELWGFEGTLAGHPTARSIPLAGVAEMADRTKFDNWEVNLPGVLIEN